MPFTLVGFEQSQDSATLVPVAALADQHVRISGNDIVVPDFADKVIAVYAVGAALTRAQLVSPTLRKLLNLEISPVDRAAEPSSPYPIIDRRTNPLQLARSEQLNAQAAEDGAGAQISRVFVWLADGPVQPVTEGDVRTIRATNASTLVAEAWTNGALTFADTLPAGRYQVRGMKAFSAGLCAARLVFPGSGFRPGCVGDDLQSDIQHPMFRNGGLGAWGEFEHDQPPSVDFMSLSADTAQVVLLDVVQVREGRA